MVSHRKFLTISWCFASVALGCLGRLPAEDKHWSFRPILRPPVPVTRRGDWGRNAIDQFILESLERKAIAPSPEADRITLLRRLSLDLNGLPPTAEEVQSWISDRSDDAYDKLVDRLLMSPHYGEKWARHWLDLCHYGDTDGHLTDQLRPVAWRYRDWVIYALNANMSFRDFTVAQLAGDLQPSRADGSVEPSVAHASDPVLGTGFLRQTLSNREGGADLEEYRVEQIVDRTSMVGMTWLGLTVGCARCHDHKYDPLTQKEFFQLYAFFDRTDEVNIDAPLAEEREEYLKSRPEYERRRTQLVVDFGVGLADLQKRWEAKLLYAEAHPGEDHVWDRQWELLGLIWGGGLGEGQLEGCQIVKLTSEKRTLRQQSDLQDYFLQHGAVTDPKLFSDLKLNELQSRLKQLAKEFPKAIASRAPVMQAALIPRTTFIHERGDFRTPGEAVNPGTPVWLGGVQRASLPASLPQPATRTEATRRDLAEWLASRGNPLTARVIVNRVWQEFYGRGIVASSDNFGVRGEAPSHPELLDWLADEFISSGWDLKHLQRLIVTSSSYRQSSEPRPDLAVVDPVNVHLARQSSLRLPAEIVRDSALVASGLMSRNLGGPGVFPPQHERVTMEAFGSNSWPTSSGSDRYRRAIYTFIQRTSPFAQSITFDAPSPARACSRRDRSNTPLQALTLLNDPTFFELAQALAKRVLAESGPDDQQRLRFLFQTCLARSPTDRELHRLSEYLNRERLHFRNPAAQSTENECWTKVASVVLNLHEFVTRD